MRSRGRIILLRPDLSPLGIEEDLLEFECSRAENAAGAFSCTLPMRDSYTALGPDTVLELQRSFDDGNTWANDLGTLWFVRALTIRQENNAEYITLAGHDALGLLERRIVAYFGVQNTEIEQTYYSIKHLPADDLVRAIIRENFTAAVNAVPADDLPGSVAAVGVSNRIMAAIQVEPDTSRGPLVKAEFAWANVAEALRNVADETQAADQRLVYDLVYDPVARLFTFRCWLGRRGADRTQSVVFSLANGNLDAVEMVKDYSEEMTWVHVGGEGQGTLRLVTAVRAEEGVFKRTPFYPIERFVDASDTKNDEELMDAKGRRELRRRAPRWIFRANALDVPWTRFGVHYGYGDAVSITHRGQYSICRIGSFRLRYQEGVAAEVGIPLESEEVL